jgi:putative transposase
VSAFPTLAAGRVRVKANADHNAARVIAARGVRLVLSGAIVQRPKKTCRVTKRKGEKRTTESHMVGVEISEPSEATQATPGETEVRRGGGNASPLWSLTQETPATTPTGV